MENATIFSELKLLVTNENESIFYMQSFDNNNMNEIYTPLGLHIAILGFNNALKHIDNT